MTEKDDTDIELKISQSRVCTKCSFLHRCQRCTKHTHICSNCGTITHVCDICGLSSDSITAIKKHQEESKHCKKIRLMTAKTYLEQMKKVGLVKHIGHTRTRSVPEVF